MTDPDHQSSLSVLLVDDHRDGGDSMAELLRLLGYRVRIARSGAEALTHLGSFAPDVAILDIGLPDIDGFELAGKLVAASIHRPVLIALTGYGHYEERSRQAGFDHFFLKPVEPNRLAGLLADCAKRPGSTPGKSGAMDQSHPASS